VKTPIVQPAPSTSTTTTTTSEKVAASEDLSAAWTAFASVATVCEEKFRKNVKKDLYAPMRTKICANRDPMTTVFGRCLKQVAQAAEDRCNAKVRVPPQYLVLKSYFQINFREKYLINIKIFFF
jgi:hypothetical protein